jgi:hypothetical protein
MTRGPFGYGRYNDDPEHVGCPRAKSDMTPCIARDGHLAMAGDPPTDCVGCRADPGTLLAELAADFPVARVYLPDPDECADKLAEVVRAATEPAPSREA